MAWCLKLPKDAQRQIELALFEATPSARAVKAFDIGGKTELKFHIAAKDPKDYILVPNKNGGRWRKGEWRTAPLTSRSRFLKIAHSGRRSQVVIYPLRPQRRKRPCSAFSH